MRWAVLTWLTARGVASGSVCPPMPYRIAEKLQRAIVLAVFAAACVGGCTPTTGQNLVTFLPIRANMNFRVANSLPGSEKTWRSASRTSSCSWIGRRKAQAGASSICLRIKAITPQPSNSSNWWNWRRGRRIATCPRTGVATPPSGDPGRRHRPRSCSSRSEGHRSPRLASRECWSERRRPLASTSRCTLICCGTLAVTRWRTKDVIPVVYKPTSAIDTSSTPCGTRSYRPIGSRAGGKTRIRRTRGSPQ